MSTPAINLAAEKLSLARYLITTAKVLLMNEQVGATWSVYRHLEGALHEVSISIMDIGSKCETGACSPEEEGSAERLWPKSSLL